LATLGAYFCIAAIILVGAYLYQPQNGAVGSFPIVLSILLLIPLYVWYRGYHKKTELSKEIKARKESIVLCGIFSLFILALSVRVPSVLLFNAPYEKTPVILLTVLTIVIVEKTDLSAFGFTIKKFGTALFYGLAFFVLLNALTLAITYSLIFMLTNQMAFQSYNYVPFLLAMPFMTFCVGISEEGLFRGYMQTHLEKICTPRKAILIQALLFGFWHFVWDLSPFNPVRMSLYIATTFLVGLLFGYFYHKTGSLTPLVFAHGLWDSVPQGIIDNPSALNVLRTIHPMSEMLVFYMPYLLTAILTFFSLKYFVKKINNT
jgi:membrane protease YdiL (CAAX protease family)